MSLASGEYDAVAASTRVDDCFDMLLNGGRIKTLTSILSSLKVCVILCRQFLTSLCRQEMMCR